MALSYLISHVLHAQLTTSLHAIRIVVVRVQLLLLLFLIESASKARVVLSASLSANRRLPNRIDDRTARSLTLQISIVLTNHFVEKVVIYQVALACRVLLVRRDRSRDVFSLEADWRCIQTIIILKLAREFGSEWRLLCCLLISRFFGGLDRLVCVVLVRLKDFQRVLGAAMPGKTWLLIRTDLATSTKARRSSSVRLGDAIDDRRRSKLVLAVFAHPHIEFVQVLVLLIRNFIFYGLHLSNV